MCFYIIICSVICFVKRGSIILSRPSCTSLLKIEFSTDIYIISIIFCFVYNISIKELSYESGIIQVQINYMGRRVLHILGFIFCKNLCFPYIIKFYYKRFLSFPESELNQSLSAIPAFCSISTLAVIF